MNELKAENESLRTELERLKKAAAKRQNNLNAPKEPRGNIWKKIGAVASVIVAATLLVAGNLLFWAGNTLTDPQKFEALVSPIIQQPEVQQAISQFTTDKLFERVDVQQILTENLPPRIQFAAPALANQVHSATQTALDRVMQNESFQQTWSTTLTTLHERFITFVKNYQGDGTIQLSDIYNKLIARLSGTKLDFLSRVSLPQQVGSITLTNATWLPAAHNIVNNIDLYKWIATILCVGFVALAIWLSRRKRRTAITIGIVFAVFMVLTLIAIRIMQNQMVSQVASTYQAAAGAVSNSLVDSLILQTRALFVFGVLIALVAWVSGPYRGATILRSRVQALFGGNIHEAVIGTRDNGLTRWLGVHKRLIQWIFVAVAALVIIILPIGMNTIFWTTLSLLIAILVLEIVAAPTSAKP